MPNHIHLVARPRTDQALGRFMHWLLTTHSQRYKSQREITGHVWQGRYKSSPIQADRHFVTVLRYVERNPVRAEIVERAIRWKWSSVQARAKIPGPMSKALVKSPVDLPPSWSDFVDEPLTSAELSRVRLSVQRGTPFGDPAWTQGTVERLGLYSTTRSIGRPSRV